MLRIGRDVHAADRDEEPGAGRRRGAQLRGQRPAAARGAVRGHLDPAGRRRCRRRARRGAVRLAPAAGQAAPARRPRRASKGSLLGPRFSNDADRAVPGRAGRRRHERFDDEAELLDHVAGAAGRGQGRRLVPGPDGVRPAGAGGAQHPRRCPLAGDAGDDEPEDQVPRELPALRPVRAAGAGRASGSTCDPGQESPYMLLVAPVLRAASRAAVDAETRRIDGSTTPTCASGSTSSAPTIPAVTHVDYSARVQTVDEARNPRFYRLLEGLRAADRLPGAGQHQLQRPRRADRLHARRTPTAASWPPTWTPWCWRTSWSPRTTRPARPAWRPARPTWPSSSSIDPVLGGSSVANSDPNATRPTMHWSDIPFDPTARPCGNSPGSGWSFFGGLALWQALVRGRSEPGAVHRRAGPGGRPGWA